MGTLPRLLLMEGFTRAATDKKNLTAASDGHFAQTVADGRVYQGSD
jgi:hypothetical protein